MDLEKKSVLDACARDKSLLDPFGDGDQSYSRPYLAYPSVPNLSRLPCEEFHDRGDDIEKVVVLSAN